MEIQKAKNKLNQTEFEQSHLPWIIVPEFINKKEEFEVLIKVGKVRHPMTDEHHIEYISLYIDERLVEKKYLKISNMPEARFKILLTDRYSVIKSRAECNLHGIWESEKEIILY